MSRRDAPPTLADAPLSVPQPPESPLDAGTLQRLANAFFSALPGRTPDLATTGAEAAAAKATALPDVGAVDLTSAVGLPPGVQAPVNVAPGGSPLATPAGLGLAAPGTFIPQGQIPGANLLPSSPSALPSLAHRAPALVTPHAVAGNGLPDNLVSTLPAYEPRFGGAALGVPGVETVTREAGRPGRDASYYFLHADDAGRTDGAGVLGETRIDDTLVTRSLFGQPLAVREGAAAGHAHDIEPPAAPPRAVNGTPEYYFLSNVLSPSGLATPGLTTPGLATPEAAEEKRTPAVPGSRVPFDVETIRRDFPVLREKVNGRPLVWFDNAATTHKPQAVIDRLAHFYAHENSNIHRAAHELAARATDAYEKARESVRRFINAPDVNEVIFVRGTTEAINLVAKSWGWQHVGEGDEIIVSHLEHHANIVPWQQLAAARGAVLKVIPVDDSGQVLLDEYQKLLSDRTRIVSVTQVSNALGTVVPVREIVALARRVGARTLVDGAQSVSHLRVDVQEIGADFFVFSGHKIFGPTGIGALWGRREVLEATPPWQGGGNMIADVTFEKTVYQPIPNKFEAGTGNIADAVGLGAALEYVERIGLENIARYEHELLEYAMRELGSIPGVRLIGTAADKTSVASFLLDGYDTEEVGRALNEEGIAVRTGHHCAQPILRRFGTETTVRPSFAFYNTFEEIDRLVAVVRRLADQRRAG